MKWPGYIAWARARYGAFKPSTCYFCNYLSHGKTCADCGMPKSCKRCEDATGGICSKHYVQLGMRESDTLREAR